MKYDTLGRDVRAVVCIGICTQLYFCGAMPTPRARKNHQPMPKRRTAIPAKTRDRVLAEFNHRCAICGADHPQLHHLDQDPANHEPLNLLPLCPNCHLVDQHRPTERPDPRKLRLFREHKDPTILKPEFEPLFRRLIFLYMVDDRSNVDGAREAIDELVAFVATLSLGDFYSPRLESLLKHSAPEVWFLDESDHEIQKRMQRRRDGQRAKLIAGRAEAIGLLVELLRYQKW